MSANKLSLDIENVGGIESDSVEFAPGLTILSGENATNRTSIINAIMAGMGSDRPSIRTGAQEGSVSLQYEGEIFERSVLSTDDGSVWQGEGLVSDIENFHLFSCLLRNNDFRRAVAAGDNVYDLVMRPVDTDQIENRIEELKTEREEIEQRRDNLSNKKNQRDQLQDEIENKESRINELEAELENIQEQIESIDETETQSDKLDETDELNDKLRELTDKENELKDALKRKRKQLEVKRNELENLRSSEFEDVSDLKNRENQINRKLSTLEEDIQQLESDKSELTPLRRALNRLADSNTAAKTINRIARKYNGDELFDKPVGESADPTDELIESNSQNICLLCGNETEPDRYENMLVEVNNIITSISDEHDEIRDEMDNLREEKKEIESKRREIEQNKDRIEKLEADIESLELEIEETETELETIAEERENLETKIEEMKEEVVEEAEDKTSELSSLKSQQTQKELRIETIEGEIESKKTELDRIQTEITSTESELTDRLPEINSQLEDLKGKVESIEKRVVEEFNTTMDTILDRLKYDSIERVWIEKSYKTVRENRSKREKPVFNLNVAREVDGSITSDVVSNLSESERVVTSLVFAFTGYIVHDMAEDSPVLLIDSVEMIDAGRLEELLNYINENVEYLIVTSLPEDTESMQIDSGAVIERPQPAD